MTCCFCWMPFVMGMMIEKWSFRCFFFRLTTGKWLHKSGKPKVDVQGWIQVKRTKQKPGAFTKSHRFCFDGETLEKHSMFMISGNVPRERNIKRRNVRGFHKLRSSVLNLFLDNFGNSFISLAHKTVTVQFISLFILWPNNWIASALKTPRGRSHILRATSVFSIKFEIKLKDESFIMKLN